MNGGNETASGEKSFVRSLTRPGLPWPDLALLVLLAILVAQTLAFLSAVSDIPVWRHDTLHYSSNFDDKLRNEGRWVVFLAFDVLRAIPPGWLWVSGLLCHGWFFWLVARPVVQDRRVALAFALLGMQIPALVAQSMWPAVNGIGGLLLVLLAGLRNRAPPAVVLIGGGLLLFGALQHYVLLLPLLYLGHAASSDRPVRGLIRLGVYWAVGILVGYAISVGMVYVLTGQVGIEPAAWRRVKPAGNVGEYLANLLSYAPTAWRDVLAVFQGWLGWTVWLALLGLRLRFTRAGVTLRAAALCLITATFLYVLLAKVGAPIAGRTALPVFAGWLALVGVTRQVSSRQALATVVGLAVLFQVYAGVNRDNLRWYTSVTGTWLTDLNALAAVAPSQPPRLMVVAGNAHAYQQRLEAELDLPAPRVMTRMLVRSGVPYDNLWISYARASQFAEVVMGHGAGAAWCETHLAGVDLTTCLNEHPNLCLHAMDIQGFMVISLRPAE